MKEKISSKEWQLLSAYLDGQLTVREQSQVEQRLRTHHHLNTALQEMRQNRMLLRSLPRRRAPRNFTLTPAMVGQTHRAPLFPNLIPVLRFSSAIAAVLLVVTLVLDLTPGLNQPAATRSADQGEEVAMESAPAAEAPAAGVMAAEGETDPDVIYWGGPPSVPAYGMGGGGGLGGGGGEGPAIEESLPNIFHEPVPLQPADLKGMGGEEVTPPPAEEESTESQITSADVPPIEGAGPILGVPPVDQRGMVVATVPPDTDAAQVTAAREAAPATGSSLRIVQVALAALALLALIGAAWLTRKTRS